MSDVNMTKTEAYNRIMEYVKVAQEAVNNNQENKVIRFTDAGGERRVSTCDTDSIKGAFHWFRSGKNKHENNLTRDDFRDCLLAFCGKQKISELSKDLQDALMTENFEHTGKPLSAKRIMEVAQKGLAKEHVISAPSRRKDYSRIMLDPAYRKECAQKALDRVGGEENFNKLLMKQPVDLQADKCKAVHIDKLCTLPGDMANSVQVLEKLGFPREFLCAVNFADGTSMGGGIILCWNTQEEKCFEKMSIDLVALLMEKGLVKAEYEEKYNGMAFHFVNPLNGGLSPASDPYLLKFQRKDDGKEENLVNMAMPSLNHTSEGFDNHNFSHRILDVKKREIGAKFDSFYLAAKLISSPILPKNGSSTEQKDYKYVLDNMSETERADYYKERNKYIDDKINELIGNVDGGEERRTILLNYAQTCYELLNDEVAERTSIQTKITEEREDLKEDKRILEKNKLSLKKNIEELESLETLISSFKESNIGINLKLELERIEVNLEMTREALKKDDPEGAQTKEQLEKKKLELEKNKKSLETLISSIKDPDAEETPITELEQIGSELEQTLEKKKNELEENGRKLEAKVRELEENEQRSENALSPLGLTCSKLEMEELMKIMQYGGEDLGVDHFGENSEEQAENALKKALEIHHAHQKALNKPDELTDEEAKLEESYKKLQQNYEENVYEEISKALIQARKAGMKAFPIGAMGCGTFRNDRTVIGRLAARAFLDYGGDMIPMFNMFNPGDNVEILRELVDAFNAELVARGHEPILRVEDLMDDTRLQTVAKETTKEIVKGEMSTLVKWDDVNLGPDSEIEDSKIDEVSNKLKKNIEIVKNFKLEKEEKTELLAGILRKFFEDFLLRDEMKADRKYTARIEEQLVKLEEIADKFLGDEEDAQKDGIKGLHNVFNTCFQFLQMINLEREIEGQTQLNISRLFFGILKRIQ